MQIYERQKLFPCVKAHKEGNRIRRVGSTLLAVSKIY